MARHALKLLQHNNAFSRYSETLYKVPQESILGLLLFNIYIDDIFFDIIKLQYR